MRPFPGVLRAGIQTMEIVRLLIGTVRRMKKAAGETRSSAKLSSADCESLRIVLNDVETMAMVIAHSFASAEVRVTTHRGCRKGASNERNGCRVIKHRHPLCSAPGMCK